MMSDRREKEITIRQRVTVDAEIADEIAWLNEQGVRTEACCSGHGQEPPHALIKPSSASRAEELGYSVDWDAHPPLVKIELMGKDGSFEVELRDGRRAQLQATIEQPYLGASFSAGFVEGAEPDAVYLRLEKAGQEPTTILMRPDEMQAVVWVCSGALWSAAFRNATSNK